MGRKFKFFNFSVYVVASGKPDLILTSLFKYHSILFNCQGNHKCQFRFDRNGRVSGLFPSRWWMSRNETVSRVSFRMVLIHGNQPSDWLISHWFWEFNYVPYYRSWLNICRFWSSIFSYHFYVTHGIVYKELIDINSTRIPSLKKYQIICPRK